MATYFNHSITIDRYFRMYITIFHLSMKKIEHKNLRLCMTKKIIQFRRNRATVIIRVQILVAKSFYINICKKRKPKRRIVTHFDSLTCGPRIPFSQPPTIQCRWYGTLECWTRVLNMGILAMAKGNFKKHLFIFKHKINNYCRHFTNYSKMAS